MGVRITARAKSGWTKETAEPLSILNMYLFITFILLLALC